MSGDGIEFVRVNSVAVSGSTRATTAQVSAGGAEGDDNTAERFDAVEITQPLGLLASPTITSTTEAVCVRRGDEMVALVLIDKGAAAQDVESGETRLHGVGGDNATAVIRLRADGSIEITAATSQTLSLNTTSAAINVTTTTSGAVNITAGGSSDIVLNGGSLKVARATDNVNETVNMATWMTQVSTAINGLAPGSVNPAVPLSFATISPAAGATRVKA